MTTTDAGVAPLERQVRPLAGMRKGIRVRGDKNMPPQRMTMHWIHTPHNRMHWCNCMPGFRVGTGLHFPVNVRGRSDLKRKRLRMRSFVDELLAHSKRPNVELTCASTASS